ncbi:SDR family oxidoreductase [Paenibacillus arenilitoris]|uniref:SDR family oxidoreductase n=1 Tax=Paenibacillus arenilitoris TaxID=2772299 RepID=A0A927CTY4_9BACL|nr:SDR family oxidoreductase [Paenibacillus arenilitoris]MBD2871811.1 SDR family oxidoreductase [Paenibacillus arenilitoris]
MNRLHGKVALVTGGSRGIGRGIALRLAREGALVAVHYGSRQNAAEDVVKSIKANGGEGFSIGANLNSVAGVNQLIQLLDEELKHRTGNTEFDILINNAGMGIPESFEETTETAFDAIFAVNVKAPFFLVQQSLSRIRNEGRIVNISSGVTRVAYPPIMAYNLTKGAINTFTLHLAKLLGPRGITVNAVLPGMVRTDMNADFLDSPEAQKLPADIVALGRMGEPSDIADVVAFLASQDGRFVTAQLLDVTGGSHL